MNISPIYTVFLRFVLSLNRFKMALNNLTMALKGFILLVFDNKIMFSLNFVINERKCMNISPIYTVFLRFY